MNVQAEEPEGVLVALEHERAKLECMLTSSIEVS